MTSTNAPDNPPATVYETVVMTDEQIVATNAAYAAMGLAIVVIDVSQYSAKLERQANGTYKRTQIRKPKAVKNEAGTNTK